MEGKKAQDEDDVTATKRISHYISSPTYTLEVSATVVFVAKVTTLHLWILMGKRIADEIEEIISYEGNFHKIQNFILLFCLPYQILSINL